MDINFRLEFMLVFLSLPLLAGRELAAQSRYDRMREAADSYYKLSDLKMSEDGNWLTVRKIYDLNGDTVLIFNSNNTEQPVGYRTMISGIDFLYNNSILMNGSGQAELLKPEEGVSHYFNGVIQTQTTGKGEQFLLLYGDTENNRLELRDCYGSLLVSLNNVTRFFDTGDGIIYATAQNENNGYDLYSIKDSHLQNIYNSDNNIKYLDFHHSVQGIMLYNQMPDNGLLEAVYLDLKTESSFSFNEVFPVPAKKGFSRPLGNGDAFFLKLLVPGKEEDNSTVDIWYGNDKNLERKFHQPVDYLYYVWEPKEKIAHILGNDSLPDNISVGNERYFLSFDSFGLQDYTSEETPLKMYVYDRHKNHYTFMDTTGMVFYLSSQGEYVLSQKDNKWWVYHVPSAGKKLIDNEDLGTPWFTDDGKAVLFTGYSGLWRYELSTGVLSEEAVFTNYETSIVNDDWNAEYARIAVLYSMQESISKPLIVKLYDPLNNETSYVLWDNGKSEVIVPSTTNNIQFFHYNRSYDCFSWLEENYNMPPRMVSRKDGEDMGIVFQSNKADKTVLSLRQEIISYTDSDGMPLKGALYYPLGYKPSEKYPMVALIYQKQLKYSSLYPYPSFYDGMGCNIRLFLEKGYFVYMPDILIKGEYGTGMEALDCVNRSLDAISLNPLIDKGRIGLIGHSFGGYETDFVATHSNRFAAYISGAGHSDLIWAACSFNYHFLYPDFKRIESGQYKMSKSFSEDKSLYFENSPLFYADRVSAPILLWTGREDENISSSHTMSFYTSLRRNNKTVIALFYPNEGHGIQNAGMLVDLTTRTLDWFDYFLKGNTDIGWISKGLGD